MSSEPRPYLKSCGFIVFRDRPNLSFLLMRHHDRWDLPKGHVDPGETELQCALRELVEESGIDRNDIEVTPGFRFVQRYPVWLKKNNREPLAKELIIFLAKLKRPVEIELSEHIDYRWFDWNPPHQIQAQTIDPLLSQIEEFWTHHR